MDLNNTHVVVLGAGVVGLSTALKLQERGYQVTIIAETFPSDVKNIRYTSFWAGAHHVAQPGATPKHKAMEMETFRVMWDMSIQEAEGCFLRIPQTEYFCEEGHTANILSDMPDFRHLNSDELIPGAKVGVTFNTFSIDVPVYLNYLLSRFLSRPGGRIVRACVQHVHQIIEGAFCQPVDALVTCVGLGARTLGGVEDKAVFPVRGQTVLIRAPWIKFGRTLSSLTEGLTYIIPRRSGDVILGGTKVSNDWYPYPRPETCTDICRRALEICPELVSASGDRAPTIDNLRPLIIDEGCGLRPARTGGIRLETEILQPLIPGGKEIPMVHNYGHSGAGYQSSWGSARIAADLVDEAFGKSRS